MSYFIKFWYPPLQWFQRSTDNCGKIHVRIILGHPICLPKRRRHMCNCRTLHRPLSVLVIYSGMCYQRSDVWPPDGIGRCYWIDTLSVTCGHVTHSRRATSRYHGDWCRLASVMSPSSLQPAAGILIRCRYS